MNKIRKVKIDLFRSSLHKDLFELLKPHLNQDEQLEAVRRLMFMTSEEVRNAVIKFQAINKK